MISQTRHEITLAEYWLKGAGSNIVQFSVHGVVQSTTVQSSLVQYIAVQ